ncbi:MAG: hypothetical protein JSS69_16995 [Acidobacteria bacterium]|nr:hypothetical protein [Acidobacteriota bacterium]MBS1867613.1 hypothetical protein [Acidobacteriota bacterium]
MRERSIAKLERELRGKLLNAASRLLSEAEKQAAEGRPHLLRTIVAISRSAATTEAAKTRAELADSALELKATIHELAAQAPDDLAIEIDLPRPERA